MLLSGTETEVRKELMIVNALKTFIFILETLIMKPLELHFVEMDTIRKAFCEKKIRICQFKLTC